MYLYASKSKIQLIPIAIPENNRRNNSFFIELKLIFCFVVIKYAAINAAASTALYKASSPELTAMLLVNIPSVPKMAIEILSIALAFIFLFIVIIAPILTGLSIILHPAAVVNIY